VSGKSDQNFFWCTYKKKQNYNLQIIFNITSVQQCVCTTSNALTTHSNFRTSIVTKPALVCHWVRTHRE